jgi:inner membrane protein
MDNVTHTLIGFALGRVARGRRKEPDPTLTWAAVIGSNLPDLDFVTPVFVSLFDHQPKLEYLLLHRGHSHTFALAPLLAAVTTGLALWIGGEKSLRRAGKVFALALIALAVHIGADSWNNYGVHPFYPWNNRWYYGDFVFILEPFIWLALIPLAIEECRKLWARGFWVLLGVGLLIFCGFSRYTPFPVPLALLAWGAVIAWIQWKARGPWPGLIALALILVSFRVGSLSAREKLMAFADPTEQSVQLSLTPAPSNPFCWRAIWVSVEKPSRYRIRSANVSLWPSEFSPIDGCGYSPRGGTAPEMRADLVSTSNVQWLSMYTGELSELRTLSRENCEFQAFLRFARAPFWTADTGGGVLVGDRRFAREQAKGFSEIEIPPKPNCASWIPPWVPPTQAALVTP